MRGILLHAVTESRRHPDVVGPFLTDVNVLAEQVATIVAHTQVLSLDEVLDYVAEGRPPPPRSVHLSIDGGFLSTLEAAEVLDRHHLPWTLFVTVEAVLDGRPPWFVRLADAVEASTYVLDAGGIVHDLSDRTGKGRFLELAQSVIRTCARGEQEALTDWILSFAGIAEPDETRWPFLQVGHLRQLVSAGVAVGSHSASDLDLTRVSPERLDREVEASTRLAGALGRPIRYFAYPDGRHDRRVRAAVAAHHDLAVGRSSLLGADGRFALGREDAGASRLGVDVALGFASDASVNVGSHVRRLVHRREAHRLKSCFSKRTGDGRVPVR